MMRTHTLAVGVLSSFIATCFLLQPPIAGAASFDCTRADSAVERMVCNSPKLSRLDDLLDKTYAARLRAASNVSVERQQQRDWLSTKRDACADADCLRKAYRQRIMALWHRDAPVDFGEPDKLTPVFDRHSGQYGKVALQYVDASENPVGTPFLLKRNLPSTVFTVRLPGSNETRTIALGPESQGLHGGGSLGYYIGSIISPKQGIIKEHVGLAEGDGSTGPAAAVLLKDCLVVVWITTDTAPGQYAPPGAPMHFRMRAYDFDLNPLGPARTLFTRTQHNSSNLKLSATTSGFALAWHEYVPNKGGMLLRLFSVNGDALATSPLVYRWSANRYPVKLAGVTAYQDGSVCVAVVSTPFGRRQEFDQVYLDPKARATGNNWICRWREHLAKLGTGEADKPTPVAAPWLKSFLMQSRAPRRPALQWIPEKTAIPPVFGGGPAQVSRDQRWLLSALGQSKQFTLWDLDNAYRKTTVTLDQRLYDDSSIRFTADNRFCVVALGRSPIQVYTLSGGTKLGEIGLVDGHFPSHIGISDNRRVLVYDGVYLTRVDLDQDGYRYKSDDVLLKGNSAVLELSPDGNRVVRVDHLGNVTLYRYINEPDIGRIGVDQVATTRYSNGKHALLGAWDAAHHQIAIAWNDGTIVGYSTDTLAETYRLKVGSGWVARARRSGNGRFLALTTRSDYTPQATNQLVLVDLATRKPRLLVKDQRRFLTAIPADDGKHYFLFTMNDSRVHAVTDEPITVDDTPHRFSREESTLPSNSDDCHVWVAHYLTSRLIDEQRQKKFSSLVQLKTIGPSSKDVAEMKKTMNDCQVKAEISRRTNEEIKALNAQSKRGNAGGAKLHVVGVYEGPVHRPGPGNNNVTVKVNADDAPVVLVLLSYESIEWHVVPAYGVKIKKIIISGLHDSSVTGIDPGMVPVEKAYYGYAYDQKTFARIKAKVRAGTGYQVSSFNGSYRGTVLTVN